jgi:hypothetical protein
MVYTKIADAMKDRWDASSLRRQAKDAWLRRKDRGTYKELTEAADALDNEAQQLEKEAKQEQK